MGELINIFIKSVFIENMIFAYFLGMCSYLAVSKSVKTANGLGLAVIFVLGVTVPLNYLLENYVLKEGALTWLDADFASVDLGFLSFLMYIAVVASVVQLVEMIVEKFAPALYGALGIFLPLIAVNCSILGGALFMQDRQYPTLAEATREGLVWSSVVVTIAGLFVYSVLGLVLSTVLLLRRAELPGLLKLFAGLLMVACLMQLTVVLGLFNVVLFPVILLVLAVYFIRGGYEVEVV